MLLLVQSVNYAPEQRSVKVPVGIFTQKQYVYQAIAILEKKATNADVPQTCIKQDLDGLFLAKEGKLPLNYLRLCAEMRENNRVAIYNEVGEVEYAIWFFEPNTMPPDVTTTVTADETEPEAEDTTETAEDGDDTVPAADGVQPTLL